MVHECSIQFSQQPATDTNLSQLNPLQYTPFLPKIHFNVRVYHPMRVWGPELVSLMISRKHVCKLPVVFPFVLHVPPISYSLICSPYLYLVKSTNDDAPHCAVFSSVLLLPLSSVQIFSPAPCTLTQFSSLRVRVLSFTSIQNKR
jgi:hypothetical protein